MASNIIARVSARTRGEAHVASMIKDPDGINHGLAVLKTPAGKKIALVCLCGLQFWSHPKCILPKPGDFQTREAFLRAFRTAIGVRSADPGKKKARKVHGLSKTKAQKRDWF